MPRTGECESSRRRCRGSERAIRLNSPVVHLMAITRTIRASFDGFLKSNWQFCSKLGQPRSEVSWALLTQTGTPLSRDRCRLSPEVRCGKTNARPRNETVPGVRPPVTRSWRTSMAKRSFVQKTQRTIVGAAKSGVARVQEIDVKGITAAATAAAEIAVQAVMKSMMGREGKTRGRMTARKKPVRRTKRKSARKTSRRKRR